MRPVDKDAEPLKSDGSVATFTEYTQARKYLIDTIGEYCSYCERCIPTSLAVEHKLPKIHHETLELAWSNFLLACTNCNSTKGHQDINLSDFFWPDKDNTYEKFIYDMSGVVKVNSILSPEDIEKAQRLIKLTGLDRIQASSGTTKWEEASDRRYEQRLEAFKDANMYAKKYRDANNDLKVILLPLLIDIAKKGFWSIWMHAFEGFPEVQRKLIEEFKGTRQTYF